MVIEERMELVKNLRKKKYNCCQAVACSFAEDYGIDESHLMRITEGFGGGMATQSVCGAATALVILSGLEKSDGDIENPSTKHKTYGTVREMLEEFEKRAGSLICAELKESGTDKAFKSCDECIEDAVRIFDKYISESEK